jgi:hypothetical protein
MSNIIKNNTLSEIESPFTGAIIKVNFTDKRFTTNLLKLIKKYQNIENDLNEKFEKAKEIEDPIDRLIACSDIEVETLTEFKKSVNDTFRTNLIDSYYGEDYLPNIEEYFPLFESIMPYVNSAVSAKNAAMAEISKKYNISNFNQVGLQEA